MTARVVILPDGRRATHKREWPYWPHATGCPDPPLPDYKRLDRLRAKAGGLVAREIAAAIRDGETARWQTAMRAIVGTEGRADVRAKRQVAADEAGEFYLSTADGIVAQMAQAELLTWRQAEALNTLARLRRASGWRPAWERPGGRGERPQELEDAAGREFAMLVGLIAEPTRGHVVAMLATGEWQVAARVSRIQDAADTVADRLKLARDA